ncbi:MAG: TetR family transcriptional regulator [Acidobacteriia bacterium]|nr:TetR family transcriptional regulator [Terriglobia bacterium]
MKTAPVKPRLGSRGRPEQSRAAILKAAVIEFSREGVAGARTDAIARAARVNKALLYYYFKDKEALYSAVLDQVFGGLTESVQAAFALQVPPRETILAYARAHFDYIASHPLYPRIVQGEMMRATRGGATQLERIVKQYFLPLSRQLAQVLKEGMASGDFRQVDPMQFVSSMIAVIVFYFTNAPAMRLMSGADPLAPERIAARRAAVLDFISAALFQPPGSQRQGASQ